MTLHFPTIADCVGNTPLVRLQRLPGDTSNTLLVKLEGNNPAGSVKDRPALSMINRAELRGDIQPGDTLIEATSGNTGMGLALAACVKGYKCMFVTTDKQSKEKADILKAVGAEVIVCPTNVLPEDPRSYYSVAKRLGQEIPNSMYMNQYDNLANRQAHYESTGPEIWEQTEGKITHFVVGVGTGGTISGVGKYLKEKNPNIKIWGIDTYGSVFKKYKETGIFDENEIYPYITEGIGEDILPANVDFDVIDLFEKVTDKDAAVYTRRIAREEGIFVGNSAGSAIKGLLQLKDQLTADDVVVVLFHDHGSRYIGKIFNDDWMRERGFLDEHMLTAADLVAKHADKPLVSLYAEELVSHAIAKMRNFGISQIPVMKDGVFVGSIDDSHVYQLLVEDPALRDAPISSIMNAPFPVVNHATHIEDICKLINKQTPAVLVQLENGKFHIVSRYDVISAIS